MSVVSLINGKENSQEKAMNSDNQEIALNQILLLEQFEPCLLYTSPSPRDRG